MDSYQTILDGTGLKPTDEEQELKGKSWFEIATASYDIDRIAFSEYHAVGSPSAAFMIRRGSFKLNYYVGYELEFFDLENDPEETVNQAKKKNYAGLVDEFLEYLSSICDPDNVDRLAKDDQNKLVAKHGGPEKALKIGTPGATPVPGQ